MSYKVTIKAAPANRYAELWRNQINGDGQPLTMGDLLDAVKQQCPTANTKATDEQRAMVLTEVVHPHATSNGICEWTFAMSRST